MNITVQCPGSKSMTQRALIIASLAQEPTTVEGALSCDDSQNLQRILERLGVGVTSRDSRVMVTPKAMAGDGSVLFCGNGGTTIRFASCLSLVCEGQLVLDGNARMRERPIAPLVDGLRQLGVDAQYLGLPCHAPVSFQRTDTPKKTVQLGASLSSQFASGLLLVAPRLPRGLDLRLSDQPVSVPYLRMTTEMMRRAGADVVWSKPDRIVVRPGAYHADRIDVEPDWSTAAFLLAAGELAGHDVRIPGLLDHSRSVQGDAVFLEYLQELRRPFPRRFDLVDCPDLIAPLSVVALFARCPTAIRGVEHARAKESDRIQVLCDQLRTLGARVDEHRDGLDIHPLRGIPVGRFELDPAHDHRMAMAFGLLSLRVAGVRVRHPECVSKSYPGFWKELERFRGESAVELRGHD